MKRNSSPDNYLENIPVRSSHLNWTISDEGKVTLEIENIGFFNHIAQKFFGKPKTSYVHLDDIGSFVWPLIDGERNILSLGESVNEHFGEDAQPLYERLAKFFQILQSYNFIQFK